MAAAAVETIALGKSYRLTPVLLEVDLRVDAGRAAVIIGGNGAGKSTLLAILAGLSAPTAGVAMVLRQDSRRLDSAARRRIGMLEHRSFLYPNLTAAENLEFYGALYGVADPRGVALGWLRRVGLANFAGERVRKFSRGMEQRLAAARAMLAAPDLLLLDEPFAALDSDGAAIMADLIRGELARGCAIVASAHGALAIEGVALEQYQISRGRVVPYLEKSGPSRARRLRSLLGRQSQ
ncbi:MAG TPA: ATP-binding cassette domain-containing protein [Candidatus Binataceae bacterium]|nr:ATP-binding cassette domain-containing protein [Candidatus Binataceae bacterium]